MLCVRFASYLSRRVVIKKNFIAAKQSGVHLGWGGGGGGGSPPWSHFASPLGIFLNFHKQKGKLKCEWLSIYVVGTVSYQIKRATTATNTCTQNSISELKIIEYAAQVSAATIEQFSDSMLSGQRDIFFSENNVLLDAYNKLTDS